MGPPHVSREGGCGEVGLGGDDHLHHVFRGREEVGRRGDEQTAPLAFRMREAAGETAPFCFPRCPSDAEECVGRRLERSTGGSYTSAGKLLCIPYEFADG